MQPTKFGWDRPCEIGVPEVKDGKKREVTDMRCHWPKERHVGQR